MTPEQDTSNQKGLSIKDVVVRIVVVISLVELAIMLFFHSVQFEIGPIQEAFLDAFLLSVLSAPFIYYWVILPFIRARDEAEEHVRHMALHDALTGLPNRRLLDLHVTRAVALCQRDKVFGALFLIDLDGFKPVNDRHGHDAGDFVLKHVSELLKRVLRQSDMAARLGGDEFVVLLNHLGTDAEAAENNASVIAEKLRVNIAQSVEYQNLALNIDSSIGVRLLEPEQVTVESLLRDADSAMYDAKKSGRACIKYYRSSHA